MPYATVLTVLMFLPINIEATGAQSESDAATLRPQVPRVKAMLQY